MTSSSSQQPSSLSSISSLYRLFTLDDALAEPQELVLDPASSLIYAAQRCRQGHSQAPVEWSSDVAVVDADATSPSAGSVVAVIDISPCAGPHAMQLDQAAGLLHVEVETDGQGARGTLSVDLATRSVVQFVPGGSGGSHGVSSSASSRRNGGREAAEAQVAGGLADFVAEVDLVSGRVLRRVQVPSSERRRAGSERHIAFSAPAIQFARYIGDQGPQVLDVERDLVVYVLREVLGVQMLYVCSRSVLLT
ncbi:hypothetical protein NKR23_g10771 [Pleurostoma richardsiae]|uniref:Uncharacterized protein n=1 Tax=Pleurostoma richardsiae TaxID=41990 RepID=A0AA38RLB8_9PEZI|nr:hypothetical protein NKR23_g10771 [Pleurostoma richardsiae]